MKARSFQLEHFALRMLLWTFVILTAVFAVEFVLESWLAGEPRGSLALTSTLNMSLASTVSRAFNNLTAMVLAFIALAIPITANMYTPRLIEIFVRDRINVMVLGFFALSGANAIFIQAMGFPQWQPVVMYTALWISGVLGFAILLPYYFYVLSFLDPDRIIERVTARIVEEYEGIGDDEHRIGAAQKRLHERVLHLGNVILRSVDRADRDVAIGSIRALQRAIEAYAPHKRRAPPAWFTLREDLDMGLSEDAIAFNVKERIWVERRCLSQLLLAYDAAMRRMPDAVSAISHVNRHVALHASENGDEQLVGLCVRFFNTYLRSALRNRDTHSIYDVLYQYRKMAQELAGRHDSIAGEVAGHFRYYGEFARFQGLTFVCELAAFETALLVRSAYKAGSPSRVATLDALLAFGADRAGERLATAQALVGGYFSKRDDATVELQRVRESLASMPRATLERAQKAVRETRDPVFWEVTDRQRNLDYFEPEHRDAVIEVLRVALEAPRE